MPATDRDPSGLDALRATEPRRFWRSLAELADTPAFRTSLQNEFPELAARFDAGIDRRTALKMLGASLMISGLAACKPAQQIATYVEQPEAVKAGRPRLYATSIAFDGYGMGVLAESHEGRPTKIEGNARHPASLGGTDPIMQASVFSLYDPDRSRVALRDGVTASWSAFQADISRLRDVHIADGGRGLAIAIGPHTSPTLLRQLGQLRQMFPHFRLYRRAALEAEARRLASQSAFGRPDLLPVYDLARATTIVALDADFLGDGPGKLALARQFAEWRRTRQGDGGAIQRLYAIGSTPSLTSAMADNRQIVHPGAMDTAVAELSKAIADAAGQDIFGQISADIHAGNSPLFIAGSRAAQFTQHMAHSLNAAAGSVGHSVSYIADPMVVPDGAGSIHDLANDADAGAITDLFVLGIDLVHTAAGDLDMESSLREIARIHHLGSHLDQTALLAHWHVPEAHALEGWSDCRAFDGTASIVQPLIEPLYDGRTVHEILNTLLGQFAATPLETIRQTWQPLLDDKGWHDALRDGVIPGTKAPFVSVGAPSAAQPLTETDTSGVALVLAPDPYLRDGAHAANLWLQELPRPLSKLVWGNAAQMGQALADRLGVRQGDLVALSRGTGSVTLPVFIEPGSAPETIAVMLGHGRPVTHGHEAVGANAFPLLQGRLGWQANTIDVQKLAGTGRIITTQEHHAMEGRDLVRVVSLDELPEPTTPNEPQPTLYPEHEEPEESWGMSIDLDSCIGCMACVSACQSENNTPVVGPDEMERGHDMHWLRVDRYYAGDETNPQTVFQPVPCMQCEDAPCEVVCPVNATVHTHDGLNAQIYNRCIGTRYCSQNCPYKVRRFNFFDYQDFSHDSPLSLLMNPDVSVRSRGVMEKCTYCVQRISAARIDSEINDTPIADGSVRTACQQACPTQAITFGNIKDKTSVVSAQKARPQSYAMLAELNTRPRTTYLPRVTNASSEDDDD
jgi:molybdopterin-containing oxidoreductase family iron-sulfur binding subunit